MKIVAATAMSIFTLFSVFSAAVAWFEMVKNVDGNASSMNVTNKDGALKKISFHDLNTASSTNSTYVFNAGTNTRGTLTMNWKTGIPDEINDVSVSLGRYEPLDESHPLLLLFEFNSPFHASALDITATTETDAFIGWITSATGNPLTSVIKYQSIYFTEDPTTNNTIQFAKSSLSEAGHFVNISYDNEGYPVINENGGFVQTQLLYHRENDQTTISHVGIVLDYYEDAMAYLYALNLGNELFEADASDEDSGVVKFVCDWEIIV